MVGVSTLNVSKLSYRLYKDSDMVNVIELWEKHSEWGCITEAQFRKWYVDTPYGSSIIIIAETETGELVGQTMFMPSKTIVNKITVKALRVFAPVLHLNIRGISIRDYEHPVYAMFRLGMKIGTSQNFYFIYSFPSVGWLALVKTFSRYGIPLADMATFDCISYSLMDASMYHELKAGNTLVTVEKDINSEYDELWDEAIGMFPLCTSIIRNKERLRFKLGPHLVLAVRSAIDKKLIGYVAIRRMNGLIVDMLARTVTDLEIVLHSAIKHLHHNFPTRLNFKLKEVKAILFPATQEVFKNIKHEKVNFKFAFFCSHLEACIDPTFLQVERWFMMPED